MNKSCPFPIPATEELRQAINKLDLTMPLAKVMDTTEGYGAGAPTWLDVLSVIPNVSYS